MDNRSKRIQRERTLHPDIANAIKAPFLEAIEALKIIVANARIQPDWDMAGMTDIFAVPLDDINNAVRVIGKLEGRKS